MRTQQDNQVRLVALDNLEAMCAYVSGTCHRYWIEKVTRSRVWVGYSNPNEYGTEHPFYAVFPAYPSDWTDDKPSERLVTKDHGNPRVVLDCLRIVGARNEYDPIQSFFLVLDLTGVPQRAPKCLTSRYMPSLAIKWSPRSTSATNSTRTSPKISPKLCRTV